MEVKQETIIGFADHLINFENEAEWLIDYRFSSNHQRRNLVVSPKVTDWADNSVRLLVARELESPERVMGVLYACLIFQPNAGKEFIVEDLLVRRDLPTEQKRNTTLALFVEFHKMNSSLCGINWFQLGGRGFCGSMAEQWITATDANFTSYSATVFLYSFDLTNSKLVQNLLTKKASSKDYNYCIREAITVEDGNEVFKQYEKLEALLEEVPIKLPHERDTFVSHLMHSGSKEPGGLAYNGAYLVEDTSSSSASCINYYLVTHTARVFGALIWTATFAPSRGVQFIVNTLFVEESGRRRGVGTQLLLRAVEKALALDCHIVDLVVDHSNESVANFYKRCGFVHNSDIEQWIGHYTGGAKI